MENKIQDAYRASRDIYDDVLTQGSFWSRLYIRFLPKMLSFGPKIL